MGRMKNPYHISTFYKLFSGQTISQPAKPIVKPNIKPINNKPIQKQQNQK